MPQRGHEAEKKHHQKKMEAKRLKCLLFTICLLGSCIKASGQRFKVDSLYYFKTSDSTCEVTYNPGAESTFQKYKGEIVIPDQVSYNGTTLKVTAIGSEAFYGSVFMTKVKIGNNVNTIGEMAFSQCNGLTTFTIPNSVKTIGKYAFHYCSITDMYIGSAVDSISSDAIQNCYYLTNINVDKANKTFADVDGILYSKDLSSILRFPENKQQTTFTIPNNVKVIGSGAFSGHRFLTNVTIPNSVTAIGDYAFSQCTNLTSINIPNSVTEIGSRAFLACEKLASANIPDGIKTVERYTFSGAPITSIIIPNSVVTIKGYAFSRCSLANVRIGNSVEIIEECAFQNNKDLTEIILPSSLTKIEDASFSGCSNLTAVYSLNPTPPSSGHSICDKAVYSNATLYVPTGSLSAYKEAYGWNRFINIQETDPAGIKTTTADGPGKMYIYNLQGRKLGNPQRGLNIINGKKVMVK